ETIVLKAMEKNPAERYATAQELADDLHRWLADQPIRARRPSLAQRARKWVRRHPSAMWGAAIILFLTAAGSAAATVLIARERNEAIQERKTAERERDSAQRSLYASHMNRALRAWEVGDIEEVQELLDHSRPEPGQPDLRGWEWAYLDAL